MTVKERKIVVREKGLCRNCLNTGYFVASCPKSGFCKICTDKHSSFLHPITRSNSNEANVNVAAVNASSGSVSTQPTSMALEKKHGRIGLAVIAVNVRCTGSKRFLTTYAFLDNGSNTTFCTNKLAIRLGAKGKTVNLDLMAMNGGSNENCQLISLEISGVDNGRSVIAPNVYSKSTLPISNNVISTQEDIEQWPHLNGVEVSSIDSDIELLIGGDVPEVLQPLEVRTSDDSGPYATRTMFGWVVNGPLNSGQQTNFCNFVSKQEMNLDEQFKRFCSMEFNDLDSDQVGLSQSDIQALKIMEESVILKNGHYQVSMPWKTTPSTLPNNYTMAEHRLKSLKTRLERSDDIHAKYTEFMQDLVDNGHTRKVAEASKISPRWYFPHHPVLHPQKPGKLRVVFDCFAKFNGICLNDKLYQGPDLTNSLVGVLLRFRCSPIAFCADIKKMFYQVNVTESDADFLRYLWRENGDLTKPAQEYQMFVHLFGGRSSPSCANFALNRTVEEHGKQFDPIVSEVVKSNFYVDDLLKSADDEEEAINKAVQVKQLLACGGFNLTKWISNSSKLVSMLSDAGDSKSAFLCSGDQQRALGICWLVGEDSLGYTISPRTKPTTRRGILSVVSSVFDPLGLAAPFILKAKLLLQELCRLGYDWDSRISTESEAKWQQWLSDLENLKDFRIQRCYKSAKMGKIVRCELHNFGDASSTSYGAASYLWQKDEDGRMDCTLVAAKSRLTPIKAQTIPRLELQAALLTARLNTMAKRELNELQIDQSVCWTDSTCVLRYLHNENTRFKTYVGNRVSAILSRTSIDQWKFVNSAQNPADLASRGMTAEEMISSEMWQCGPTFLKEDKSKWPQMPDDLAIKINDPEVKARTYVIETKDNHFNTLMMRYSSWMLLAKVVAWILRYKTNLMKRVIGGKPPPRKRNPNSIQPITVNELKNAEKVILMYVQQSCFPDELTSLKNGSALKLTSALVKLDPILVDGIMKVGGRLKCSNLENEAMHQIILPKTHHVTVLILRHYHYITGHSGVESTMAEVRQRFWPINGRVSLKSIVRKCVECRRVSGSTLQQKMSDLPADRVQATLPPFTNVGIDCFGPFYIKQGRARMKRYGIIFTCLNVRAVHLEVSNSLDTESFINALRRFIARRGIPSLICSDNGGNFVKGNKELRESIRGWNQEQIHGHLLQRQIEWRFNPPTASHHRGVWERCIRSVRKVLTALTKEQVLKDEGLRTLFCEVENIVNNRPITRVFDDPKDSQPLTPNHLLLLRSGSQLPPATLDHGDSYSTKRWRQIQYLANVFWRRWIKEYLPSLQERRKWYRNQPNLKVGDIVIVFDENTPRSIWPLARVIEVYTNNNDGLVRSVKIKTQTGTLVRPITKLVSLEIAVGE
ncbi:uncharacterized protein LOC117100162 [Anneissia japonica]|uniref:uncharacterized protein LOC117100162 n=1 Tax=Anneissia japonica TaxID=1529436 RepID=UPI001425AFAD|nr:uncharacterized protein LOC117100162 [Anneissia japonica]